MLLKSIFYHLFVSFKFFFNYLSFSLLIILKYSFYVFFPISIIVEGKVILNLAHVAQIKLIQNTC